MAMDQAISKAANADAAKRACMTARGETNKRAYTVDSTRYETGKRRAKPSHSRLNNVNETGPGLRLASFIDFGRLGGSDHPRRQRATIAVPETEATVKPEVSRSLDRALQLVRVVKPGW